MSHNWREKIFKVYMKKRCFYSKLLNSSNSSSSSSRGKQGHKFLQETLGLFQLTPSLFLAAGLGLFSPFLEEKGIDGGFLYLFLAFKTIVCSKLTFSSIFMPVFFPKSLLTIHLKTTEGNPL